MCWRHLCLGMARHGRWSRRCGRLLEMGHLSLDVLGMQML